MILLFDEKQAIGKVDYNFTQNHSMFARYIGTTYFYSPPFGKTDGNVLSTVLGGTMSSRLFIEVREKQGLCYYVGSSPDSSSTTEAVLPP